MECFCVFVLCLVILLLSVLLETNYWTQGNTLLFISDNLFSFFVYSDALLDVLVGGVGAVKRTQTEKKEAHWLSWLGWMSVMSIINIRVDVSFQTALKVKFTHSCHTRCSCFLSSDEKKLRFLKNKTFSFLQIVDFKGTKRVQIAISVQLQRFYTIPAKEQGSYKAKYLFIFLKKTKKHLYTF